MTNHTGKEQAQFDIIVPTHGHLDLTIQCIKALYENTNFPFHLIVMDDSTPDMDEGTDLTPTWMDRFANRHDNATYIHSQFPYRSSLSLLKQAYTQCITPYAAIVVNSVTVEPDWDVAAFQFIKNVPDAGMVGLMCLYWGTEVVQSVGLGTTPDGCTITDIGKGKMSHRCLSYGIFECDGVQGALVFTKKEAVEPNLDGDVYYGFRGCEDVEICWSIREKGWKVYSCGLGFGYHKLLSTRKFKSDELKLKNYQNKEIFAKRWGLWSESLKTNPFTREFLPQIKERLDHRLPPVIMVDFKGEIIKQQLKEVCV